MQNQHIFLKTIQNDNGDKVCCKANKLKRMMQQYHNSYLYKSKASSGGFAHFLSYTYLLHILADCKAFRDQAKKEMKLRKTRSKLFMPLCHYLFLDREQREVSTKLFFKL